MHVPMYCRGMLILTGLKGRSIMYCLTQGPESVILKYCQWMASEGKNVSHLSVNELIICPSAPCPHVPPSPLFFFCSPGNKACVLLHSTQLRSQLFSLASCYCYRVTPPSGTLKHFTEVNAEFLLNGFTKQSLNEAL